MQLYIVHNYRIKEGGKKRISKESGMALENKGGGKMGTGSHKRMLEVLFK